MRQRHGGSTVRSLGCYHQAMCHVKRVMVGAAGGTGLPSQSAECSPHPGDSGSHGRARDWFSTGRGSARGQPVRASADNVGCPHG